jgi:uncharacterized protein YqgV (UPF0045/DUF77 family)
MIAEIQCLPTPAGSADVPYAHIDAAISVVAASGLDYEVGALGTTLQGPDAVVWDVLRRAHEATMRAGAHHVVTVLKVFSPAGDGPDMGELVSSHR